MNSLIENANAGAATAHADALRQFDAHPSVKEDLSASTRFFPSGVVNRWAKVVSGWNEHDGLRFRLLYINGLRGEWSTDLDSLVAEAQTITTDSELPGGPFDGEG